jgi:hypothetical protein
MENAVINGSRATGPPRINCNKTIASGFCYERVFIFPISSGVIIKKVEHSEGLGNAGRVYNAGKTDRMLSFGPAIFLNSVISS